MDLLGTSDLSIPQLLFILVIKFFETYSLIYWMQYQNYCPPTPFGETLCHVLIEAAHCHNRHQIDLRKLEMLNTDLRNIRNQIFKEHWSAEIEVRFYQIESFSSNSTLFPRWTVFTSSLWRHAVKANLAWQGEISKLQ